VLTLLLCLVRSISNSFSTHVSHTFCLQVLKPLIIGFLINVKEGALVLLTPSGQVPGLPPRFTKRCPLFCIPVRVVILTTLHDTTSNYRSAAIQPDSLCYTGDADVQQCCLVACLYLLLHHQCSVDNKAALDPVTNAAQARCIQVQLCQISQHDAADTTNAHVLVHKHSFNDVNDVTLRDCQNCLINQDAQDRLLWRN